MVSRAGVIDAVLAVVGIYLLLQTVGSIRLATSGRYDAIFGWFEAAFFIVAGTLLLRYVYKRRKKRKIAEQEDERAMQQQRTPIGLPFVSTERKVTIPRGAKLVAYYSVGIGILQLLEAGMIAGFPQLFSSLLSMPPLSFLYNPVVVAAAGVGSLAVAYGLFKQKRWGWKWGVIGLYVTSGWSIVTAILQPSSASYIETAISLGLDIWMIYYMCRPHVKSYYDVASNNPLRR